MDRVETNVKVEVLKSELKQEHRNLKEELLGYEGRRYLTPQEQIARRELQKRKLHVKDRLQILNHMT